MRATARRMVTGAFKLSVVFAIGTLVSAPAAGRSGSVLASSDFQLTGELTQGGFAIGRLPAGASDLRLDGSPILVAPDGRFLIGFGRDAPPSAMLEARSAAGGRLRQRFAVTQRVFPAEKVAGLKKFDQQPMSRAAVARRQVELANIRMARIMSGPALHWTEPLIWPVSGRLSGHYGSQRLLNGAPIGTHFGVDIAAPAGTPVVAPAAGRVKLAASGYSLEGGIVILDHGFGLMSTFLHLSRVDVKPGTHVASGMRIGAVGSTGRSTGPHLHWAMHWGRTHIDPALFVGPIDTAAHRAATTKRPS